MVVVVAIDTFAIVVGGDASLTVANMTVDSVFLVVKGKDVTIADFVAAVGMIACSEVAVSKDVLVLGLVVMGTVEVDINAVPASLEEAVLFRMGVPEENRGSVETVDVPSTAVNKVDVATAVPALLSDVAMLIGAELVVLDITAVLVAFVGRTVVLVVA